MIPAFIALGSNLGKRQTALRAALAQIAKIPGTQLQSVATFRETAPVDAPANSPFFMNSAVKVETTQSAPELLQHLLRIERELGRTRIDQPVHAPRTIDLDLLLYGNQIIHAPGIDVPHPRMHKRRFVLEPLAEIAPQFVHPEKGKTIRQLLDELLAVALSGDASAAERKAS